MDFSRDADSLDTKLLYGGEKDTQLLAAAEAMATRRLQWVLLVFLLSQGVASVLLKYNRTDWKVFPIFSWSLFCCELRRDDSRDDIHKSCRGQWLLTAK